MVAGSRNTPNFSRTTPSPGGRSKTGWGVRHLRIEIVDPGASQGAS